MPAPELATLVSEPPKGAEGWFHETKMDGYRVLAELSRKRVTLRTRRGHDWTTHAPSIASRLQALAAKNAVLDGELVVLRKDGISDFQALQNTLRAGNQGSLVYFVFDLLSLDGKDLRGRSLRERKRHLEALLQASNLGPQVRYCDHLETEGARVFSRACKLGLEGIVSKRADSLYQGRRSLDWQKTKCSARQELVVGGYTRPSGSRQHFGALLMGLRENGSLRYVGKVGTGFSQQSLRELKARLSPLEVDEPAFADPPTGAEARDVHWVKPKLVAEIEFTEFTKDRRLRHPSFRGLRDDKRATEVHRERPQRTRRAQTGGR